MYTARQTVRRPALRALGYKANFTVGEDSTPGPGSGFYGRNSVYAYSGQRSPARMPVFHPVGPAKPVTPIPKKGPAPVTTHKKPTTPILHPVGPAKCQGASCPGNQTNQATQA